MKGIRTKALVIFALAVVGSAFVWLTAVFFWGGVDETAALANLKGVQADVVEAVYRYQMLSEDFQGQRKPKTFFLGLDGKDPPAEFMCRFTNSTIGVRQGSASGLDPDALWDPRIGVLLQVDSLKRKFANTYVVEGGFTTGPKGGESCTYVVFRSAGVWRVVKRIVRAVA